MDFLFKKNKTTEKEHYILTIKGLNSNQENKLQFILKKTLKIELNTNDTLRKFGLFCFICKTTEEMANSLRFLMINFCKNHNLKYE